ncbi:uncharacterized protein LOC120651279 [Panicum virgatum]|uniref:uncharacterized protein LOC120651279 n=1 Tax=Panicum virgatum TaxID=38727 RepID=UPI0019D52E4D|nr:uncharacterized protein LOC120651279 [Panicum virgatum]
MKRIKSGSQKLQINFASRLGGPTGHNSRSFVDEVVKFTRQRAPLIGVKKWSDIELTVKKSIAFDIMNRWDIQNTEDEKKKIWAIAKDRYKGWRSTFSATYKAYNNYHARMKHKPEDLDIVEWHYLILYFGSNEFLKASNRNSKNCKQKRTNHSMGSVPFSKISDEQRDPETGEEPRDLSLWMHTHMRNGQWSDKASQDVYDHACLKVAEKERVNWIHAIIIFRVH